MLFRSNREGDSVYVLLRCTEAMGLAQQLLAQLSCS